ncbi:MAG: hypothetical protein Q4F13_09350 [Pseudomonadota bacterium]|nr:hypothetical protein [Pseudomonadota bacterium]
MTEPRMAQAVCWRTRACQTLVALGVAAMAAACQPSGTTKEVQRLTSPDGVLDAVIVEHNHGATTPFVHEVAVLPKGSAMDSAQTVVRLVSATRNDQNWGADVQWLSPTQLHVSYFQARQVREQRSTIQVAGRQVQITLQSGVRSPGALPQK